MASATIDLLIGRVVSLLENEAYLLRGVSDEIRKMKQELITIGSFLKDAEKTNNLTEGQKTWVGEVRDIAYDLEDTIVEFSYHMNRQRGGAQFARFLRSIIYFPKNVWIRHQIAAKLQTINGEIRSIQERSTRYVVEGIGGSNDHKHNWAQNYGESSYLCTKEDVTVGTEAEKQMLMEWLMDGEPQLTVVSIVGMGGSGKTTLASKTCNDEIVKRHFECYAWVTVSQTYVKEDLLQRLIKELYSAIKKDVPTDLNSMVYKELIEMLVSHLSPKKYLIVLDDVWDVKLWKEIKASFPDSQRGSRIIVTTRKDDVGSFAFGGRRFSVHVEPLTEDEAWSLFCMKAFSSKHCPSDIEELAWELVGRCNGLPLAIVCLGGLMFSKKSITEWRQVKESLNWQLDNNPMLEEVKSILLLSFNDLPYRLKHCFLYCCLFPEDYSVRRKRLIRLWLAEGFVEQVNGVTPEEVADTYLMELVSRSMLQVVRRNAYGRPKACKMHDLMRELALTTSERENFIAVYDGKHATEECKARRLAIQTTDEELKSFTGMSKLRSLLVFVYDEASLAFSDSLPSGFKMLKVLDVEDMPINKLPSEVPYLFNLRYLNLKRTPIRELPASIENLHNLETLDIRDSKIEKLPKGIAKLKKLRHLIMYRYTQNFKAFRYVDGTQVPSDICHLKKLQVMACVESQGDIIKRVGNMTQLRRIGITNVKQQDEINLCSSIKKLKFLHYLFLMATNEEELLKMDALSSPPPRLQVLILVGKLERAPKWLMSLQSLTFLYLHWSRLAEDVLPYIEELPNLGRLTLTNACAVECLRFGRGFEKLDRLSLRNFPQLTEIIIEDGVMPNLREMYVDSVMKLRALPPGIQYLTKLENLYIPETLVENGVDISMVDHVPNVYLLTVL